MKTALNFTSKILLFIILLSFIQKNKDNESRGGIAVNFLPIALQVLFWVQRIIILAEKPENLRKIRKTKIYFWF